MPIRLLIERDGKSEHFSKAYGPVTIGRAARNSPVDINLTNDTSVSRLHARIWEERGEYWIADIDSRHGTFLNGEDIRGRGQKRVGYEDGIRIGACKIRFEKPERTVQADEDPSICKPTAPHLPDAESDPAQQGRGNIENDADSGISVVEHLDGKGSGVVGHEIDSTTLELQLDRLCDLALKLGAETDLRRLQQVALEQTIRVIPRAMRGAILLVERGNGRLMLTAQLPSEYRPSERLARRAMERSEGFAWVRAEIASATDFSDLGNGMFVPLIAGGSVFGAMCVDTPPSRSQFSKSDLRVFRAIGQFFGMALAQHQARVLMARQTDLTNRLFRSRFPEKVRNALLADASEGSLPIGTQRSMVTILHSDIRGFTRLSEEIGPQRLSDLLNAYFPALIDAVFAYGGVVERFVGDAIFAVFGSPQPDHDQQEHTVLAAIAMQQAVAEISAFRAKHKQPTCGIGIGIDCGEVLHGFIGNAVALEFTVIGDPANYASRYCAGAQAGEILISPNFRSHVWKLVDSEMRMITAKHEGEMEAHLVKGLRASAAPPSC